MKKVKNVNYFCAKKSIDSTMKKCVFLDRDGVLNKEVGDYVYRTDELIVPEGTAEALRRMKDAGYLLIVITNQAGIARGLYTRDDVRKCHEYIQQQVGNVLDDLYFSPHHPTYSTASLLRKPDSLMLEKAMAKYKIDKTQSWMIGDTLRDVQAGKKAGVRTIHLTDKPHESQGDVVLTTLLEAAAAVLG
jgi:D-glycero-D-manno-heptose 1,7-bisphosphate phosphatase